MNLFSLHSYLFLLLFHLQNENLLIYNFCKCFILLHIREYLHQSLSSKRKERWWSFRILLDPKKCGLIARCWMLQNLNMLRRLENRPVKKSLAFFVSKIFRFQRKETKRRKFFCVRTKWFWPFLWDLRRHMSSNSFSSNFTLQIQIS